MKIIPGSKTTAIKFLSFLFLLWSFQAISQIQAPKPDTYVNDYTNSLTEEEVLSLNNRLLQLEQESTVQLAIILIHNLPADMPIEDYAIVVGNTWKVGLNFNGMVYVAVLNDRRQRLEIARNLEGQIPDITAARIIDEMVPYLRQQNYYEALSVLIRETRSVVVPENSMLQDSFQVTFIPMKSIPYSEQLGWEREQFEKEKAKYNHYGDIVIWVIIGGVFIFCIWSWKYKRGYVKRNTVNGIYIGAGTAYFDSVYGSSSSDSSGGGFGGFGGGGGGGFSGGGASGGW